MRRQGLSAEEAGKRLDVAERLATQLADVPADQARHAIDMRLRGTERQFAIELQLLTAKTKDFAGRPKRALSADEIFGTENVEPSRPRAEAPTPQEAPPGTPPEAPPGAPAPPKAQPAAPTPPKAATAAKTGVAEPRERLIREFAAGLEVSASGKKQIQKMPFAELEAALVKKYGSRQVLDSILEQLHPAGEKTQKPPEPAPEAPAPKPPAPEAPPPAPKPPEAAPKEAGKTGYENVPLERVKKDAAAGVKSAQQELQVRTAAHPEPAKPAEAPEPAKTPFKTGAARKAKIKELLDQGRSYAEIAAEIGVSKQRVGQIAKTEGWAEAKKEASQAAARESGVQRGTEEQAGEAGFSAPAELRDRTPQEIHEENVDRLADYITNARKAGSTDPELARLEAFHGRQAFTPAGPKAMKKILAKAAEIELAAYNEKAVRDAQQSVQRSEHEATPLSREDIAQAHERSDAQQAELRAEAERVAALKQSGGTAEPAPGAPNPPVPGGVNEPLPPQQYREQGGTMGGGALIPVGADRQP